MTISAFDYNTQLLDENFEQGQRIKSLLAQIADLQSDYDRSRRRIDDQSATIDALTKQAQNASDKRTAVQLKAGVHAAHAMLRHVTGKVALGHDERPWVDAVKAWLFENGASVYEEQTELRDARALLVEAGR